jgi:hypothetical protein
VLHWEPAGDELAFSDGAHSGVGQLNHWAWIDYMGSVGGRGWQWSHQVDFGSSDNDATHALLLDLEAHPIAAYVAPITLARRIVRQQRLEPEP